MELWWHRLRRVSSSKEQEEAQKISCRQCDLDRGRVAPFGSMVASPRRSTIGRCSTTKSVPNDIGMDPRELRRHKTWQNETVCILQEESKSTLKTSYLATT
mmetsp:Transcript_9040/g.16404  ORF Transcript_9040/g.16404 Transcript_9040/m.16404 type:complete len:101 (+) Transcript_9040:1173-1475(+)